MKLNKAIEKHLSELEDNDKNEAVNVLVERLIIESVDFSVQKFLTYEFKRRFHLQHRRQANKLFAHTLLPNEGEVAIEDAIWRTYDERLSYLVEVMQEALKEA